MKKMIFLLTVLVCFLTGGSVLAMTLEYDGGVHSYTGNLYDLFVDGKQVSTPLEPIIFNDRALVPVREVMEAMGAAVDYKDGNITITQHGISILMQIGNSTVTVSGEKKTIPDNVAPKLIAKQGESAKTMVPVRFISETLGYAVDFDGSCISIHEPGVTPEIKREPNTLTGLYCKQTGATVKISVTAEKTITQYKNLILTESGVLYLDIPNSSSQLPSNSTVGKGAVKAVRVGVHDGYTRIALDVQNLKDYTAELSDDRKTLSIYTLQRSDTKQEKIVVIDAGHGGHDGGASAAYDDVSYYEKDLTLAIAQQTAKILEENGVKTILTRNTDVFLELADRSAVANNANAAIFCSVHINSVDNAPQANGVEVYYAKTNNEKDYGMTSSEVAQKVLDHIIKNTGATNRRVKSAQHVVTRTSSMPAILVECGFISNEAELKKMESADYQYLLAAGIATGLKQSLSGITVPTSDTIVKTDDLGTKL